MSYNDKVYHVDSVKVNFNEEKKLHDAVFHAKEVSAEKFFDLHFIIPEMLCDVLVEYAKLDDSDAILVLNVKGNSFVWNLLSDAWLKQTSCTQSFKQYVA